jgi:voltage-gated potassium channel
MPLVDLFAILPFYVPMVFAIDLRFVRALRLFRLLRLFKVGRYSGALRLVGRVFRDKKEELGVAAFAAAILFCIVSAFMYHLENARQPEAFSSIFAAMWWSVSALTPLNCDVAPMTDGGRVFAGLVAFSGVALFALPAGIFASGFSAALAERKTTTPTCPQCGADLGHVKPS